MFPQETLVPNSCISSISVTYSSMCPSYVRCKPRIRQDAGGREVSQAWKALVLRELRAWTEDKNVPGLSWHTTEARALTEWPMSLESLAIKWGPWVWEGWGPLSWHVPCAWCPQDCQCPTWWLSHVFFEFPSLIAPSPPVLSPHFGFNTFECLPIVFDPNQAAREEAGLAQFFPGLRLYCSILSWAWDGWLE